jgi:diguanylate cyclase (GGDEF)-like protein/PAS domain S-box-containing protein
MLGYLFANAQNRDAEWMALGLALLAGILVYVNTLGHWDNQIYDLETRLWSSEPSKDIVIVAIDENSLAKLGRWPWSRRRHAELVNKLTQAEAKVIGLDLILTEPDTNDPEADVLLTQALRASGRVVLPLMAESSPFQDRFRVTFPLQHFVEAVAGLGHVEAALDDDGIARSVYLRAGFAAPTWSSLGLAMLEQANGGAWDALSAECQTQSYMGFPSQWVRDCKIMIPYAGPPGRITRVSYADVLQDDLVAASLRGKYVLVGVTAPGLGGRIPTPTASIGHLMPGVEFNATVLNNLYQESWVRPASLPWRIGVTIALVLLPALIYPRLRTMGTLLAMVSLLLLTTFVSSVLLHAFHLWLPPGAAMLTLLVSFPVWIWRQLHSSVTSLRDEKERTNATLHAICDAVITTDPDGKVTYINPMAETMTGYSLAVAHGRHLDSIFHLLPDSEDKTLENPIAQCLDKKKMFRSSGHSTLVHRSGQRWAVRTSANCILDRAGKLQGMVVAFSDVTETVQMTQEMMFRATHDTLTELPSRNLLEDRLKQALANARRTQLGIAVLFMDLDGFKKVNDGMGHNAGDELLKEVSARLQTSSRRGDTVARWGGDEFVIVLENLPNQEVVAGIAHKLLGLLTAPFTIDGQELYISCSMGISLYPRDGENTETLLKKADAAMYRAKDGGRNNFRFYSEDVNDWATERLLLEKNLRHALQRKELEVVYQPQVSLVNGRIIGVEALLRWRHPGLGMIGPSKFIPLAEESELINHIGEWVVQTACSQAKAWQDEGLPPMSMSVNLSPRQFLRRELFERIAGILTESGLDPGSLKVEITESLLLRDLDRVAATLREFKSLGIGVSIDDFGTGYSSLSYLKRFPIDQLKIDQSFVRDITIDAGDKAIAEAVIGLAHSMKLEVIAEGVENLDQLNILMDKDCDAIQGFYFSHPLPASEMTEFLRETGGLITTPRLMSPVLERLVH